MFTVPPLQHWFIYCFCYAWAGQIVLQLYQATKFSFYVRTSNARRAIILAILIPMWPILLASMIHQFWIIPLINWLADND